MNAAKRRRLTDAAIVELAKEKVADLGDDVIVVEAGRAEQLDPNVEDVAGGAWVKAFVWVSFEDA